MFKWFKKKSVSGTPSPDWSDEKILEALGQDSGTMLEQLKSQPQRWRDVAQQALFIKYQRKTIWVSLGVGIIGMASLGVSVWLPVYQHNQQVQSELSALYRAVDANGDIFVGNYDNMRFFAASDTIANLPDAYVDYIIPDDLDQPLQQQLGMVNYTWLLYYVDETKFLNQMRDELNTSLIVSGATSPEYINAKKVYVATMNYLGATSGDGYDKTKFAYVTDTGCLQYLLQQGFASIPVSKFDKTVSCSDDSLNRIYYWFGYLPPLTPRWMFPLLRNALDQRQAGLGDYLVPTSTESE